MNFEIHSATGFDYCKAVHINNPVAHFKLRGRRWDQRATFTVLFPTMSISASSPFKVLGGAWSHST